MTFKYIASLYKEDSEYEARTRELTIRRAILDGRLYDVLTREFDEEKDGNTYVPIRKRKPSVQTGTALCRTVVEQTTSMLFGDDRFPAVSAGDPKANDLFAEFIRETRLVEKMRDAAHRGSVGSVAIHMRVLPNRQNKHRTYFDVYDTQFLTPEWDAFEPDRLIKITERKRTKGRELKRLGYAIAKDDLDKTYWFVRVFDEEAERWFLPVENADEAESFPDTLRSVQHDLGFCPWVWIKNLHGGDGIDGKCTFEAGIKTCIEIDYLASQVGRGLKYSMDPLLVIKEPPAPAAVDRTGSALDPEVHIGWTDAAGQSLDQPLQRGGDTALVLDPTGDAYQLELSGTAAQAVMAQVEKLRQYAVEAMQGSLVNPDQINSHQGAKALEILHAPLIRLTDNLRSTYGENGLLALLRMFLMASKTRQLWVNDQLVSLGKVEPRDLVLHWNSWFPMTENEIATRVNSLLAATGGKPIMSSGKAVNILAPLFDINDPEAEILAIGEEKQEAIAEAQAAMETQQDNADAKPNEGPTDSATTAPKQTK
ncbi:hypothetical protein D3C72_688230 [compost metagenome]